MALQIIGTAIMHPDQRCDSRVAAVSHKSPNILCYHQRHAYHCVITGKKNVVKVMAHTVSVQPIHAIQQFEVIF
mgnify:CR=1 FL=1